MGREYAGCTEPDGYDNVVVRGNLTSGHFIAFWTAQGRILAGVNVNIWDVNEQIRHLTHSGNRIDSAGLANRPDVPLDELAAK
ncbi:hypothetical protein C6376_37615 [Streptomyces sp. P3]|nr:hypothetical protein C6376_37615 [Streptomyces sp. P3]